MTSGPSTVFPCPGCGIGLDELGREGVEMAVCAQCHGIWLDAGALDKRGAALPAGMQLETVGKRVCPRCEQSMGVYFHDLLEIDRCQFCQGIYLDPGEIDLLIKARRVAVPPKASGAAPTSHSPQAAQPGEGPKFVCDLCRKWVPVEQQVVGEDLTVCASCAKQRNVRHDPRARRMADLRRQQEATQPPAVDTVDDSPSRSAWSRMDGGDWAVFALDTLALLARIIR